MGITKNHIHSQRQINMARLFKALGHPARIAIVETFLAHENLNCNDLRNHIQLAQSTISAHVKELHEVGILGVTVIGNNAYYQINKIIVDEVTDYLDQISQKIDFRHENFSFYLRPMQLDLYNPNTA